MVVFLWCTYHGRSDVATRASHIFGFFAIMSGDAPAIWREGLAQCATDAPHADRQLGGRPLGVEEAWSERLIHSFNLGFKNKPTTCGLRQVLAEDALKLVLQRRVGYHNHDRRHTHVFVVSDRVNVAKLAPQLSVGLARQTVCLQQAAQRAQNRRQKHICFCSEPLGGPCSCLKKQNSCAKNRSIPLDRLSEPIPCEVLAYLCLREHESCLPPHIAPASSSTDASPSLSLSRRVWCIRLMLCLSFHEWRRIDAGEQMILAPFLGRTSRDRAPGRFPDFLFVPKHDKADMLLKTNMRPVRSGQCAPA